MIIKMEKIHIYGPRELIDPVTSILYKMGVLHIEQLPPSITAKAAVKERLTEDRESAREKVELESLIDKVRKTIILLPRPAEPKEGVDTWFLTKGLDSEETVKVVNELYQKVDEAFSRKKELQDRVGILRKYEKMIKVLAPVVENVPETEHLEMVGLTIDRKDEEVIELIKDQISRITGENYHIFTSKIDSKTTAAIIAFGKSFAPRIKELLWEQNLNEIKLPSDLENLPLKEALEAITLQASDLPKELRKIEEEIEVISKQWYFFLSEMKDSIQAKMAQINASASFLKTRYSFVIGGWIPKKSFPALSEKLESDFGGKVVLEKVPITEEDKDRIPIHVVNHPLIKPFEVFVRLLPNPVYGTIDPTPFFAFFFPIFFGLILGDMGYGLVALALAIFLRKKLKRGTAMHDISTVLLYASFYCIFFGFLFGEFFGTLGEHFPHPFTLHPIHIGDVKLDRLKEIPFFLGLAVLVGAIHIFLGIALGVINAILGHHKKHLIFKIGQFVSLLSLVILIAILAGQLNRGLLWPTAIILVAGLVTITFTEGFIAPIEILSAMGNILSYARIMAIGLSSVILALVANELGKISTNLFVGILIAGSLHLINIIIGIFSPTIHSMRLHLVEFFGKFYETGGAEYKPFKKHGGD